MNQKSRPTYGELIDGGAGLRIGDIWNRHYSDQSTRRAEASPRTPSKEAIVAALNGDSETAARLQVIHDLQQQIPVPRADSPSPFTLRDQIVAKLRDIDNI